jgi:phosphoglycolate phosphatase
MKCDAILFDLDGTLWDAVDRIRDSWNAVLLRHPEYKRDPITRTELERCMGMLLPDIGRRLFADLSEEKALVLMEECCEYENEYLREHGGILYPNLEETLKTLSESFALCVVSNCQDGYIQAFLEAHRLSSLFTDFESAGATGHAKADNCRLVTRRNRFLHPVYVGDTQGDANAAKEAGIPFVYASYGFGQVKAEDMAASVSSFAELAAPGFFEK